MKLLDPVWVKNNDGQRKNLIIHHSAADDNRSQDGWAAIDSYHRSFRIDFNVVAAPVARVTDVVKDTTGLTKFKDSWYKLAEVQAFYEKAGVPFGVSPLTIEHAGSYFQAAWRTIGYNLGIELENNQLVVRYGRTLREAGAHCPNMNMNATSVGICVLGDYDHYPLPPNKCNFLCDVIQDLFEGLGKLTLYGHHEVKGVTKSCPGKLFPLQYVKGMFINQPSSGAV